MRLNGIMPFFILSLLVVAGCIVACVCNHTAKDAVLRGMAVTCLISCSIVVSHWMLRKNPAGFKWFILGAAVSLMVSAFVLQQSVEVSLYGESAKEIMSGPIFWIKRLGGIVMAPVLGWYLRVPKVYVLFAPIFMAGFSMFTSISGRGAAVRAIMFFALAILGGQRQRTMMRLQKHFWAVCTCGIALVVAVYFAYKFTASTGLLGDNARAKYEAQTHGGKGGVGRLLLGGRGSSFIGFLACIDKPIIGWGPWARDENGYAEEFIEKFGTWEDVNNLASDRAWRIRKGIQETSLLECHAYITEFWAWYGIWGLVFWLYVIFVLFRYLKQDVAAVPQWYAWLACSIPGVFWGIFFSPFADRFNLPLFVVACLMARAVRRGRFRLPAEMIKEIERGART